MTVAVDCYSLIDTAIAAAVVGSMMIVCQGTKRFGYHLVLQLLATDITDHSRNCYWSRRSSSTLDHKVVTVDNLAAAPGNSDNC